MSLPETSKRVSKLKCKLCGFIPKEGEATYHLHIKHPEAYGKMDYAIDYFSKTRANKRTFKMTNKFQCGGCERVFYSRRLFAIHRSRCPKKWKQLNGIPADKVIKLNKTRRKN